MLLKHRSTQEAHNIKPGLLEIYNTAKQHRDKENTAAAWSKTRKGLAASVDKVNAEKVQDQAPKDVIRECPNQRKNVKSANVLPTCTAAAYQTYLSWETSPLDSSASPANRAFFPFELGLLSFLLGVLVCILRLAVRTNWPTAAQKPLRKALNGYYQVESD